MSEKKGPDLLLVFLLSASILTIIALIFFTGSKVDVQQEKDKSDSTEKIFSLLITHSLLKPGDIISSNEHSYLIQGVTPRHGVIRFTKNDWTKGTFDHGYAYQLLCLPDAVIVKSRDENYSELRAKFKD